MFYCYKINLRTTKMSQQSENKNSKSSDLCKHLVFTGKDSLTKAFMKLQLKAIRSEQATRINYKY